MKITPNSIEIKPYSITELASIYGIPDKTMRKWLAPHKNAIGKRIGHFYNVLQVTIIFEKLGVPSKMED